tara:strand:+ start:91 stop:654 length:564 start_codon:yes stop_codon:yes gene_type:complete
VVSKETSSEFGKTNDGSQDQLDIVTGLVESNNSLKKDLIESIINIIVSQKNIINFNKTAIEKKLVRTKEKEKDEVTTYLKDLTDEQREVENYLKRHKLGKWSVGQTKGLFQYDPNVYDQEVKQIEKRMINEKKLGEISDVSEMNKEVLMLDMQEEEQINNDIENEEYNLDHLPDDDDYGEFDGDEYY